MEILIIANCPEGEPAPVAESSIKKQLQNPRQNAHTDTHSNTDTEVQSLIQRLFWSDLRGVNLPQAGEDEVTGVHWYLRFKVRSAVE